MKRFITLVFLAVVLAATSQAAGLAARFNAGPKPQGYDQLTMPDKMKISGERHSGVASSYTDQLGCSCWRDPSNLVVCGHDVIPTGKKFTNTGLAKNGEVIAYSFADAKAETRVTLVMCKEHKRVAAIKNNCTNVLPRGPTPKMRPVAPTVPMKETDDLSTAIDVNVVARANAAAMATVNNNVNTTASTGDTIISIVSPPQPVMAWSPLQNQFSWHSSHDQLISGSMSFSRPGDIVIWNKIQNNNANTNVNVLNNVNNIVTGNGATCWSSYQRPHSSSWTAMV